MSAIDLTLYGIIAVLVGGLIIWFLFYAFSDQTKPPSNLTQETLERLVGSKGHATSDITDLTGTAFVNNEEYSARTSKGPIQKGTHVKVTETDGMTLIVEKE
jgi:membrane-bound ClpP family serine protease